MKNADSVGTTILTQDTLPDPRHEAERAARERDVDKARVIAFDGWLAGYCAGQVDLTRMCKGIRAACKSCGMSNESTEKWIGHAVVRALDSKVSGSARKNGIPVAFKRMAAELVVLVREAEHAKVSRDPAAGDSVFDRVAAVLNEAGFSEANSRKVEDWVGSYRRAR